MGTLPALTESIWARGQKDAREALLTATFLIVDPLVALVIGSMFQSWWAGGFALLAVMGAILLVSVIVAPFKQRIEARVAFRALQADLQKTLAPPEQSPWVSAQEATQLVYDGMTSESLTGELLLRMFKKSSDQGISMWQQVGVFVAQGINEGIIVAEGFRGGRSQSQRIPPEMQRHGKEFEFRDQSEIVWKLQRAERQSIENFLKKVEDDHSEESQEHPETG